MLRFLPLFIQMVPLSHTQIYLAHVSSQVIRFQLLFYCNSQKRKQYVHETKQPISLAVFWSLLLPPILL